jgi:hypothetical protein
MAFDHVALTFGQTGQVLEFYPPQGEVVSEGAPTSAATYFIWPGTASLDDTAELSGNATLDSVSTTVSTASGYSQSNRRRIYLNSTSSIVVGRRYLLANAEGQREVVIPRLVSTLYIDVEESLAFDYAITTSTFKGLRQYFTIDATFIADEGNINIWGSSPLLTDAGDTSNQAPPWRVRWGYTTGSIARYSWTSFDVARAAAKSLLSIEELRQIIPDIHLAEQADQRGSDFAPQLKAAERDLQLDARMAGYDPDSIQDPQAYQRLLLQKWAVTVVKGFLFTRPQLNPFADSLQNDYTNLLNSLLKVALKTWLSTDSTGAVTPEPRRQLWLKPR